MDSLSNKSFTFFFKLELIRHARRSEDGRRHSILNVEIASRKQWDVVSTFVETRFVIVPKTFIV